MLTDRTIHSFTPIKQSCSAFAKNETHVVCETPNVIRVIKSRRMRWVGHVARMGERRGAYGVLVGKPEGKGPLGTHRSKCENNIKMDLRRLGCDAWMGLICLRKGTSCGLL